MDHENIAANVLEAVGGTDNIAEATTCLTRLRLKLVDPKLVNTDALQASRGVLGTFKRGFDGLDVVLGPSSIEGVGSAFEAITGMTLAPKEPSDLGVSVPGETREEAPKSNVRSRVEITPAKRMSYRAQQRAALDSNRLSEEDMNTLKAFLDTPSDKPRRSTDKAGRPSVLVINGPNLNLLGVREPDIYGRQDYASLVATCKEAAADAGFARAHCFQSNHEGVIVDEIQAAMDVYDGIVINPAAFTHTSVAILDAVKAVGLPCIEVHISDVTKREDFRKVSYVRQACIGTIMGEGLAGYRHAIFDLAKHLGI